MIGKSSIAILAAASLLASLSASAGPVDKEKCAFNGRKLYGKVQVVDSFADIKIEYVKAFPDVP